MRLQSGLLSGFAVLVFILGISVSGFSQVKKDAALSFSGTIQSISKDLKSIVITNDVNILISPNTQIIDQKGNVLKATDLKTGLYVVAETVQATEGFAARKIIIKPLRGT